MCSLTSIEKEKYEKVWNLPKYRTQSPGERSVQEFLTLHSEGESVVDIGCGTGRASLVMANKGIDIKLVDIAKNCLDQEVADALENKFTQMCFWEQEIPEADWGFCCDVMEHIPEEKVQEVLSNIHRNTDKAFLRIHLGNDIFGPIYLKQPLHLTVQPSAWWLEKIRTLWSSVDYVVSGKTLTAVVKK
jgi:2-polyprenyl-3-methyl-5-hydroxy-6-metoxy-1,4-benzoquinol methylase